MQKILFKREGKEYCVIVEDNFNLNTASDKTLQELLDHAKELKKESN